MAQVTICDGTLEGDVETSILGFQYHSFKGIPYASPPVGDLRFKAPQPPQPWAEVKSAKKYGPICHQYDIFNRLVMKGSEDCLYLNVYSRELKPSTPLPVMVWIHGGGFTKGSGNDDMYGPDFLLEKEVIVVTINYRLEVLGFLGLDIEEAPGNQGMKDQVAALKWVKNNIQYFGGDPDNITIFGESAGGASVSFHCVSPMSKGLFKRAIIQSGTSIANWSNTVDIKERAIALARQLGKDTTDPYELLEFFKSVPIDQLVNTKPLITLYESARALFDLQWVICDEKQFGDNERFFYGNCYDFLRNNRVHEGVEVIIGYTADEGLLGLHLSSVDEMIRKHNTFSDSWVSKSIAWNLPMRKLLECGKKVKEFYYGKEVVSRENLIPLIRWISMEMFVYSTLQWVKIVSAMKRSNIYLYKFCCKSERNFLGEKVCKELGLQDMVCHSDDVCHLFPVKVLNIPVDKDSKSYKMIENMTTLWTNFAKYGNPTPDSSLGAKWLPFTPAEQHYVEISDELVLNSSPEKVELDFWESIFREYLPNECSS